MQHLSEMMQFPGFLFPQVVQKHKLRCGGKIKYILIAYFLRNICAKNCHNRTVYVKIIISCKGGTFLRHSEHTAAHYTGYYYRTQNTEYRET